MSDPVKSDIVHRELETECDEPTLQIAEVVADLEEKDPTDLTTTYDCIDHVVDHVFSEPPSPQAQLQVTFNYEGYRITIEQDGTAKFVKVSSRSA